MSTSLTAVIDHMRLLGRKARHGDMRGGDLVLVKHITQERLPRLQGLFGQVHAETRQVGRRKKQTLIEHYVADELLGVEDQLAFFESSGEDLSVVDCLDDLLDELIDQGHLQLVAESAPLRFFTGEICIFEDPDQGYVRIEDYQPDSGQLEAMQRSGYVRVVRDVAPLSDRDRARLTRD
jgi:hypothetical protein